MTFKKIVTFSQVKHDHKENDIVKDMHESISYVQTVYCHPFPSEYFESIDFKLSDDKSYCEAHINFVSLDTYHSWFDLYGEITEELYLEMIEDFKPLVIKIERFFEDVEQSNCFDAQPIEQFVSKFS